MVVCAIAPQGRLLVFPGRAGATRMGLAVVILMATAATVLAEPRSVAVIDISGGAGNQVAESLSAAVSRHPGLRGIADPSVAAALVGPLNDEAAAALDNANRELSGARDAVARFAHEDAIARARLGIRLLLETTPSRETAQVLADLLFVEGTAHLGGRDELNARRVFALVHGLDPARRLDPVRFAPELIEFFAGAAIPDPARGTVSVEGEGFVWVDGAAVGAAPALVSVASGIHLVAVYSNELLARGERVDVAAGQAATVRVPAAPAPLAVSVARTRRLLATTADATTRGGAMVRIADLTRTSNALIVALTDGRLTVQPWSRQAPGFGLVSAVDPETLDTDALLAPLAPRLAATVVTRPLPPAATRPAERAWWQKRWVQASVVGGIVITTVTLLALGSSDPGMRAVDPPLGFLGESP
jgi:hypothetical protein